MTRTVRTAKTLAAAVVAALGLCASATAGGPALSSGYGCALACIESAIVTPTASSATVQVKTTVPASVTVKASKLDAELGLAAGPAPRDIVLPAFQTIRTVLLSGLEPATKYRIVVSARDMQGRVYTRAGTFATREVKVAVGQPDLGLSAGLGCKADCVDKGTLTSDPSVPGRARLVLESSVPATFQVKFVAQNASHQLVHSTGSRATEHAATIDGLLTGTTYAVTVKATDANGGSYVEQGTFRTRSARAVVTFHRVKVLSDGDKGANRGEISLGYYAAGENISWSDYARYGSGETVVPRMPGTSRPGVWGTVSVDRRFGLELDVGGDECDWTLLSNCVGEASAPWTALARTTIDLRDAFAPTGGLPPGYGTGLPAGHDAYAVFETEGGSLRFRVYATVDIEVS
jgi:hypothetical protein